MKIEIKNRWSAEIIFSHECDDNSIKTTLVFAVKNKADLRGANLYGANLYGANLYGANLNEADLRGANLYEADLREADLYGANLYGADLRGANLYEANLRGANLYEANLRGANLYGANLNGEKLTKGILSVNGLEYWCLISEGFMRLGCQRHSHKEWAAFDDQQIIEMDGKRALKFWRKWKDTLLSMCANHANEGTPNE